MNVINSINLHGHILSPPPFYFLLIQMKENLDPCFVKPVLQRFVLGKAPALGIHLFRVLAIPGEFDTLTQTIHSAF